MYPNSAKIDPEHTNKQYLVIDIVEIIESDTEVNVLDDNSTKNYSNEEVIDMNDI